MATAVAIKNTQNQIAKAQAAGDTAKAARLNASLPANLQTYTTASGKTVAAPTSSSATVSFGGAADTTIPNVNFSTGAVTYPTAAPVVVPPPQVAPPTARAPLLTIEDLAKMYNITYDEKAILDKFNAATTAEYDMKNKEYKATENAFYNKLNTSQGTALDAIRKTQAAAVSTGASRGMQAASELSSVLGMQQESVQGATDLANNKNLLVDQQGAAMTKNASTAMTTANAVKQALAGIGANIYAADTQFDVGELDYYAKLDAAKKALEGAGMAANATTTAAETTAGATRDAAAETSKGYADAANINAKGNTDVANINKESNKYVADKNYETSVYNANRNYDAAVKQGELNRDGQIALANATKFAATEAAKNNVGSDPTALTKELNGIFYDAYKTGNYAALDTYLFRAYNSNEKAAKEAKTKMISDYEGKVLGTTTGSTTVNSSTKAFGDALVSALNGDVNAAKIKAQQNPAGLVTSAALKGYNVNANEVLDYLYTIK